MTNADLRERLLLAALDEVPFSGFSHETLRRAAGAVGMAPDEVAAVFPRGPAGLVEAFSHWADARMSERMAAGVEGVRVSDRVKQALRLRIEVLVPHREASRRATAFLALPQNAPLAASLLFATVDAIWRAAGDRSSDFSYYTKRATLAGVYGATLLYWLADSSNEYADTWTFLDSRIADVMRFEAFKAAARAATAKMPDPFGLLARFGARR